MKDLTFKRKYMATLIVCSVFVMIVGSHSGYQPSKWTDIGDVVVNEISVNGKLKFDKNCDGKTDMTLTCKNVKLMPVNYPDPDKHQAYAIGRYREKCAKFFINNRNEIIKWQAYPGRQACCAKPISRCDMCPLDTSSWAGLSSTNTIYPGVYPPDINVSYTSSNRSTTAESRRNIAVDYTGRVHVVWIETEKNVRNVYYACSLPTGSWVKTDVSQFPMEDKKFQARNASIAVTPGGVPHIAWEVEIDNNKTPLNLEENDDHYVYYVYGSSGCPQSSWKTCAGTIYSPPLPSHTPGPGSYNNANVSRNDSNSSHEDAWNPAIALDNNHRPHITWQNEIDGNYKIFWVYCDDEAWKTCGGQDYQFENRSTCNAIVSQSNSSHYVAPSIAIDSNNNVHIAYHSHNFQTSASSIYYVPIVNGTTGYHCEQPRSPGYSGKYASIAVGSYNNPHIVWEDGAIKYLYFTGANWSSLVTIPDTQGCHVPCLTLDRDDKSHIVFYCNSNNNKEIFYSYRLASPVNVSSNDGNSFSPSIALDNNCNPHLLWTDETPASEREVLYVHLWCCKWTNCGIIKSKETNGMNPVKIEFYDCEKGNTMIIYGDPNLFATNADNIDWSPSNSGTIADYEEGLCAKYCLVKNADCSLQIAQWEAVPPDDPCCCGCNQVCPCVENVSPTPYCLLSNCDMQVLTSGDFSSPANAVWRQVNAIPCSEADKSAWGQRCTDLPWTYLYEHGACWVYGNQDWHDPDYTVEYYKLDFRLEKCTRLSFEAFIDDCATFYIDGTGSPIYDSCEAEFQCAKHTFESYCLEPGSHTLYIKHRDIGRHIYGLIFAAECIPCDCCCSKLCGCFGQKAPPGGYLFYENCDFNNEPMIVLGPCGNESDIYKEFQSLEDYFKQYPGQKGWCARICVINEGGEVSLQWWQALADKVPPECCPAPDCCEGKDWGIEIPLSSVNGENVNIFFDRKQCAAPGDEITFYRMFIENECDYDICVEVTSGIDDFAMYYRPGPPDANPITGPLIFEVPAGGSSDYLYGSFTMPKCQEDELVNVMTLRQVECDTHRPIPDCEEKKIHVKCCAYTCCDYELIPPKIPHHLCPGESCKLNYKIKNNCPRGYDIEFNYLYPADGSVTLTPQGPFTVPDGGTQEITVTYTMPGVLGTPCKMRSHTFRWALVTVGRNCPPTEIENQIHCKR